MQTARQEPGEPSPPKFRVLNHCLCTRGVSCVPCFKCCVQEAALCPPSQRHVFGWTHLPKPQGLEHTAVEMKFSNVVQNIGLGLSGSTDYQLVGYSHTLQVFHYKLF